MISPSWLKAYVHACIPPLANKMLLGGLWQFKISTKVGYIREAKIKYISFLRYPPSGKKLLYTPESFHEPIRYSLEVDCNLRFSTEWGRSGKPGPWLHFNRPHHGSCIHRDQLMFFLWTVFYRCFSLFLSLCFPILLFFALSLYICLSHCLPLSLSFSLFIILSLSLSDSLSIYLSFSLPNLSLSNFFLWISNHTYY